MTTTTTIDCECAREHFVHCAACGNWHGQWRWLGVLLRSSLPRTAAPAALRARIQTALNAECAERTGATLWVIAGLLAIGLTALASVSA